MTFNPNAPSTIGLEWPATTEALTPIDAAAKNAALRIVSSAAETIDQLIVPVQYSGPGSGYGRQWVDLYDMASSPVAGQVTELTFVPNEDKSKTNVTRSNFATTTNLFEVLDAEDDDPKPENSDYMVNSNYGGIGYYRCQFNTAAISSSYRIVYVKFEIRAKGFDWSWQKPKIELMWFNGSTDLGRFATINPEPDYVFRTRVLGPYYFDFYNEGRWLQPEISLLDNNASRNLGVKLSYATAISRITMKVGVVAENRVAVGISSRITVLPSGRQTNSPMLLKTPLGVDNWAKDTPKTYMAVVSRLEDPFASAQAFTPNYAYLDSGFANPHGQGDTYGVTLTGQDGLVSAYSGPGTAAYGFVLGTNGNVQSVDSQPYHTLDVEPVDTTSTLKQGVNGASAQAYSALRFLVAIRNTPNQDLTIKVKRTSDDVQMGGTATLTAADLADPAKATLVGSISYGTFGAFTYSVYAIRVALASTATLASAVDYYVEWTSTAAVATPWYVLRADATMTHALTGNETYGGSTNVASVAGVPTAAADFYATLSSSPTSLTNLSATITTYALPDNGGSECDPGNAQYVALNWASSTLGGLFSRYEVERSGDLGVTWDLVTNLTEESDSDFADYEVQPGVATMYRVRVVRTDGATSDWTTLAGTVTTTAPAGVILLVSNADPSIACGYVILGPERHLDFLDAPEAVYQRMHMRDYQVKFTPLEVRGIRWACSVLLWVGDENDPTLAPASGFGLSVFDEIRAVGRASIPYVCVLTPWGERLFGGVEIIGGDQTEPADLYVATLVFTQTAGGPTAVTI